MRLLIIAVGLVLIGCSRVNTGPLAVQTPVDWKVEHKPLGGSDFYTVTSEIPGGGLLLFSRWPVPTSVDAIPDAIKTMADGFVGMSKTNTQMQLTRHKYSVESFEGNNCKGSYAVFESATAGNLTVMFMMQVNGAIWNGQFSGGKEDWVKSLELLSTLKGRGW